MSLPPATPSPHRFLGAQKRSTSPSKDSRPTSTLRKQFLPHTAEHETPLQQQRSATQFATHPRFSTGKSRVTQRSPSPPKPALVQALRTSARRIDDVEDASDQCDDDEMLDSEHGEARFPPERSDASTLSSAQWTNNLALSPKRRKLSGIEPLQANTTSVFDQSHTQEIHLNRSAPRFTPSQAQSTQQTTSLEPAATQRPAFLRQSTAPQEPSEPLPEAFSPHRRGQKFIPGGMAATVQQWVIEAGQAAVQSRRGQGYLRGEDFVLRGKVQDINGDGPFITSAKLPNAEGIDLLLTGDNGANGSRTNVLRTGSVVGLRVPTWLIEVEGREYTVGVDWRVLS